MYKYTVGRDRRTKMTLNTHYVSPFMPEDVLTTTGETLDECKEKFFNWWECYGKTKEEAIKMVLWTEVID